MGANRIVPTLLLLLLLLSACVIATAGQQGTAQSWGAESTKITFWSYLVSKRVCASRQKALSALYSKDGNARSPGADCISGCTDAADLYLVPLFFANYKDASGWPGYKVENPSALKGMCGQKLKITGHTTGKVDEYYTWFRVDSVDEHVDAQTK